MKYEEDVEEGGERWSKPHVASLSLHSLFELRSTILNGALLLDVNVYTLAQVVGKEHIYTSQLGILKIYHNEIMLNDNFDTTIVLNSVIKLPL